MPCLAEEEMLINSTTMETNILIPEAQLPRSTSKTSASILETRDQRCGGRIVVVILLLGLLTGGIAGFGIFMNFVCSSSQELNQKNSIQTFSLSEAGPKYKVFTTQQHGYYTIYSKVHVKATDSKCRKDIRLCRDTVDNILYQCSDYVESNNTAKVDIMAFHVELKNNTTVYLMVNCGEVVKENTYFKVLIEVIHDGGLHSEG